MSESINSNQYEKDYRYYPGPNNYVDHVKSSRELLRPTYGGFKEVYTSLEQVNDS